MSHAGGAVRLPDACTAPIVTGQGKGGIVSVEALWVGQGLLAAVFSGSGAAKLMLSKDRMLATGQTGVAELPLVAIRVIAILELLAVLGLLAPLAREDLDVLAPLAACGLALIMVGAAIAHTRLHEPRNVAVNAVLFAICMTVAVGRFAQL